MPSQLVKCAFGFRRFNNPKTKCVPLSVELGSEQGGTCPRCPPYDAGPDFTSKMMIQFSQKWIMLRNALNFKGQGIQKLYTRREKKLEPKGLIIGNFASGEITLHLLSAVS